MPRFSLYNSHTNHHDGIIYLYFILSHCVPQYIPLCPTVYKYIPLALFLVQTGSTDLQDTIIIQMQLQMFERVRIAHDFTTVIPFSRTVHYSVFITLWSRSKNWCMRVDLLPTKPSSCCWWLFLFFYHNSPSRILLCIDTSDQLVHDKKVFFALSYLSFNESHFNGTTPLLYYCLQKGKHLGVY